jgi:iron complex outermembrane receptor protein
LRKLETSLYVNNINHAMDDTKRPATQISMHMDMPGHSRTAGHFTQASVQLPHQNMQFRFENFINRWHAEMTMYDNAGAMFMRTIPDAQRLVSGVDVSDAISINRLLSLVLGGRAEYSTSSVFSQSGKNQLSSIYNGNPARNDFLWNAYLQSNFSISNQVQAFVKTARALRAPTLKELYAVYLFDRVDDHEYLGNPALRNESAFNIELGASYRSSKWSVSAKGFGYFFQNYIAGAIMPGATPIMGAAGVKQYENLNRAQITGGELAGKVLFSKKISFSSTGTYQQGKDGNGNALPMISPLHMANKIEWMPTASWTLFAESVYAAAQNKASIFYGEKSTPSFDVLNAGVVKIFPFKTYKIIAGLHALNLFNRYYYEHLDVIQLPRPGRNFVVHAGGYF